MATTDRSTPFAPNTAVDEPVPQLPPNDTPARHAKHERQAIRATGLSDEELDAHRAQHRFLAHVAGLVSAAVAAGSDAEFAANAETKTTTVKEEAAEAPAWRATLMGSDADAEAAAADGASVVFDHVLGSASSHVTICDEAAVPADQVQSLQATFERLEAGHLSASDVPAAVGGAAVVASAGAAVLRVTALHVLLLAPAGNKPADEDAGEMLRRAVARILTPRSVGIAAMLEALMPPVSMCDAYLLAEPAPMPQPVAGDDEEVVRKATALFETMMLKQRPAKKELDDSWRCGGREQFMASVRRYVVTKARILFVLPAFPFKSSNQESKVLGECPDLGEYLALRRLDTFLAEIEEFYPPGARLVLFSDGRVYCDHFSIPDTTTSVFKQAIRRVCPTPRIVWSDLDMFYPGLTDDEKRVELEGLFGASDAVVDRRIKEDPDFTEVYCGFKRFMTEELSVRKAVQRARSGEAEKVSRRELLRRLRDVARRLMTRNYAYGAFVQLLFPVHVRMSIHPSTNTRKFSVDLVGHSDWGTPWHNCALLTPGGAGWALIRRETAEARGCPRLTPAEIDWAEAPFSTAAPAVAQALREAPQTMPFFIALDEDTVNAASPWTSMHSSPTSASPPAPIATGTNGACTEDVLAEMDA